MPTDTPRDEECDPFYSFGADGGASFAPLVRITDSSFPVPPITGQPTATGSFDARRSACYMGEYIAMAADANHFYYAWGDNRNTVVSAAYPGGRPDPDVYFTSEIASSTRSRSSDASTSAHAPTSTVSAGTTARRIRRGRLVMGRLPSITWETQPGGFKGTLATAEG